MSAPDTGRFPDARSVPGAADAKAARDAALARASDIVGRDDAQPYEAVVPPIFQNSLFTFASVEEMTRTYRGERPRPVYSRVHNPTVTAFERTLAALEGAEAAVGFASGMAAISAAVLSVVRPGDRVLSLEHVYPDAYRFFETFLADFGVSVDYVDGRDLAEVERRLPGARLLYLESPTSWTFDTPDVAALAALARAAGAVSVIDNSWATPVFQRPLALGVDLVVHSASKYIGGHSDVVAGVLAGSDERVGAVRSGILPYLGGKLAPFEAWLLSRGLRTLPVRLADIERSAFTLAARLAAHPHVARVRHPALASPDALPAHEGAPGAVPGIAADTALDPRALPPGLLGCTGLFGVELAEGVDIARFCDALRRFRLGVSWGGHESLVCPASVARAQVGGPNSALRFGVPERLVRLSVGLESTEALWSDLDRALETSLLA